MASYATTAQLKASGRLNVGRDDLDSVYDALLEAASRRIDRHYAHWGAGDNAWAQAANATHYFDHCSVFGKRLRLDAPLLSVTTLTNGDATTLAGSTYRLHPRNGAYFFEIRLLNSYDWLFNVDGEIAVQGKWGFATTAPPAVVEATLMLASHYYRHYSESLAEIELPDGFNPLQFANIMNTAIPRTVLDLLPPAGVNT